MSSVTSFNSLTNDLPDFDYQALLPEAVKLLTKRFGQVAVSHGSINIYLLVHFTPFFELNTWNRQTAIDNLLFNMIKAGHLVYKKELGGSVVMPWKEPAEQSPTTINQEEVASVKKENVPGETTFYLKTNKDSSEEEAWEIELVSKSQRKIDLRRKQLKDDEFLTRLDSAHYVIYGDKPNVFYCPLCDDMLDNETRLLFNERNSVEYQISLETIHYFKCHHIHPTSNFRNFVMEKCRLNKKQDIEEGTLKCEEMKPSSSSSSSSSDQFITELPHWKTQAGGYSDSVLEVLRGLKYLKDRRCDGYYFVAFDNIINANIVFFYETSENSTSKRFEELVQIGMIDMRFTNLEALRRVSEMGPEFQIYLDCMQYFNSTVGYAPVLGKYKLDKSHFKEHMDLLDPQGRCTHLSPERGISFTSSNK